MHLFQLPSFAFLTSLLLVLPPSGCGDWLRSGSVAPGPARAACCGSMAAVDHDPPGKAFACHAPSGHNAAGHAPCAPLQSVCDCCDAAEATVPVRATPPTSNAFLIAEADDPGTIRSTATSLLKRDPVCPRLRLHILKCVWRC